MEKMVDDTDTPSPTTQQPNNLGINNLGMYAATIVARRVVKEFHKSIEQLEKDLMPGAFSDV